MTETSQLRARLNRTLDDYVATRRDLALEYTSHCPRDASAWASLGSALIDLGLYSKARVALRRLEKLGRNENPYLVCVSWGGYYNAMGDSKRAERWYRKAVRTAPAALVFLGGVLARQGRLADAKRCHRQATRAPDDDRLARDEAYCNLGLIFRAERRYRVALEAQADVRTALKVEAPQEHAKHSRQMLDAMGPNPATAHELVRAYTRRYPHRFGGWVVCADVLAGFARYDEAVKALRKAEGLAKSENWREPPDNRFAIQWGLLHQQKKDFRRAELSFRRAITLRPSATNLRHLA